MSEPSVTPANTPLSLAPSMDSSGAPRVKRSPGIEGPDSSRSAGVWLGVLGIIAAAIVIGLVISQF
ncbi:hypothetical protein GCM10010401_09210 [Rarobacter faecitabidus]|uniref:Uncharacterized protein n=1 Tax=Rarobacter faecitabidus TaxID=13243 RepID=A0A542ZB53_RARFA|nr:hypothetical protein [Rarobacter faecitabidus]TQL57521.1 hypothetical protein FB461_2262 [Rarobacter faecitabidus]